MNNNMLNLKSTDSKQLPVQITGKKKLGRPPKSPEALKKAQAHTQAVRMERNHKNYYSLPENKYGRILYCGICGNTMGYYRTNLSGIHPYVMYQCKMHKVWKYGSDACPRENIRLEELESLLLTEIQKEIRLAQYLMDEINDSESSLYMRILNHYRNEMEDAYQEVGKVHRKHFQAFCDWQAGLIDEKAYSTLRKQCLTMEQEKMDIWWKKQFLYSHIHLHYSKDNSWLKAMLSLPEDKLPSKKVLREQIYRIDLYEDNRIEITWRRNLTRERLYQFLDAIQAVPKGMYNPSHRGCRNPGIFLLSEEEKKLNTSASGGETTNHEL